MADPQSSNSTSGAPEPAAALGWDEEPIAGPVTIEDLAAEVERLREVLVDVVKLLAVDSLGHREALLARLES